MIDALIVLNRNNYANYEDYIKEVAKNPIARKVKISDIEDNANILRLKSVEDKDLHRIEKYHNAYHYLKCYDNGFNN